MGADFFVASLVVEITRTSRLSQFLRANAYDPLGAAIHASKSGNSTHNWTPLEKTGLSFSA